MRDSGIYEYEGQSMGMTAAEQARFEAKEEKARERRQDAMERKAAKGERKKRPKKLGGRYNPKKTMSREESLARLAERGGAREPASPTF